ncbi:tRNA (uridine(34)/cytosine(34)/5-carboxymethylaminomethyluridine(34)-2'-O)-methyltransferase TrmL [Brevibacillus choshinensis]|uniref:tRNA (uridine(34)/cytosine(34)/5- carboxymethylaminomethyluridine(34)-2'-O)- methyltransferase TrmL n=1 Tax=Brevibacillus choshinensis TaxID=54911 RepID=UPI002E21E04F|nr:tRNA (uridine(34)/cytosine(34)/5-carboxymethylaminomethyluridine(34)-2'-O)-methyltransferase TrmL [Brevibacillus choshinensis]MED4753161.1 tRNA (uridine(34)/cytosine(34)/5-carboxymethylaminomethyluridine(34)-2'-O)-methyltransferase TrmL [Brevibacillus choshinensis]MED4782412.1 tRNA (uridine(34)/cytosine(34)/5-carboxymethylaminomethyluridine(34)-2'-O)-methyltransferase TrmL [Brevibacillus choshinensis]
MPLHIVLHEPLIPANTGNIARSCAATGAHLHLIHPLGFSTDDRYLKRAGLDYWHAVNIHYHDSFEHFAEAQGPDAGTFYFVETWGETLYSDVSFRDGDYIILGKETTGLPPELTERYREQTIRIPMSGATRSVNLSNCAAIVLFEGLRQLGFPGLK